MSRLKIFQNERFGDGDMKPRYLDVFSDVALCVVVIHLFLPRMLRSVIG
jgi:hypothetical protein